MSDEQTDPVDGEEEDGGPKSSLASVALPFATALVSVALGALLGVTVGWMAKPESLREIQIPRELTPAELEAACAPSIAETANELEQANQKVVELTREVSTQEARVQELETEMTRRAERGRALVAELEAAKQELVEVRAALARAEEEKEQLVQELNETAARLEATQQRLAQQVELTEYAKEDALTNKWYRFLNDAQLEVCERGNRKRMGRCRDTVQENLKTDELQQAFAHCVRSGQATPTVREIGKGEDLPVYAQFINEDERITRDWYILLCDPTLPEAEGGFLHEEHLPRTP